MSKSPLNCLIEIKKYMKIGKRSHLAISLMMFFSVIFVTVLFVAFLFGWFPSFNLEGVEKRGAFGDSFGPLTSLFSGLGFVGLLVTIWMQQGQLSAQEAERIEEVAERRSLFNLRACASAYDEAQALLADHNNHRATWIRAARLLRHAKTLAEGVTVREHQIDLEIGNLKYRSFFAGLIENKSAAFFYGGYSDQGLEAAAMASTAEIDVGGRMTTLNESIPEASLFAIWEAAQWPEGYSDPIGQLFTDAQREKLVFFSRGLREYLIHRQDWSSIGGRLVPRRRG